MCSDSALAGNSDERIARDISGTLKSGGSLNNFNSFLFTTMTLHPAVQPTEQEQQLLRESGSKRKTWDQLLYAIFVLSVAIKVDSVQCEGGPESYATSDDGLRDVYLTRVQGGRSRRSHRRRWPSSCTA
jgi:hypothetical protein